MEKIKIGFLPTRRNIFSAPDALKYKDLTIKRLKELDIDFADLEDINDEGLLFDDRDVAKVVEKFRREKVKGVMVAHCNFGTEYVVARVLKELQLPVLIWGPRDERPEENGVRLRDSQCGLFATGKVLRRFQIPFTYMTNCRLTDSQFERGVTDFVRVCNVADRFKRIRILQIAPRPFDFWTTMCNEGELLEKFNIQLAPVPMPELTKEIKRVKDMGCSKVTDTMNLLRENVILEVSEEELKNIAALKVAMKNLAEKYGCCAVAIQCWTALQDEIGVMPCCANGLLTAEGIPVVCETDIHGAITSVLVAAASMGENETFFADWTVRHPDNENAELLQHCGPWHYSLAEKKPVLGKPLAFNYPGSLRGSYKKGELTLVRFDGDNGEYSLLLGNAKGVDGPFNNATYLWVEVENLKRLEAKLVEGPYIHHCTAIHQDLVPVLYEACKYLGGVKADLYDPIEEKVKAYLRGE